MIIVSLVKYFKEQQSFTLVMNLVFIQFEEFHKYLEREKNKWDNTPLVIFFLWKLVASPVVYVYGLIGNWLNFI